MARLYQYKERVDVSKIDIIKNAKADTEAHSAEASLTLVDLDKPGGAKDGNITANAVFNANTILSK